MVPAGSSRTPRAFQKTLDIRFLRNRSYRPTTFPPEPRKTASNSKRIPNEWMLLHGWIQSPSPSASPSVRRSPLIRGKNRSATRTASPMIRPRVRFLTIIGTARNLVSLYFFPIRRDLT